MNNNQIIKEAFYKSLTGEEKEFVKEFMSLAEFYIEEGNKRSFSFSTALKTARDHHPDVKLANENLLFTAYFWKYGKDFESYVSGKKDSGSKGRDDVIVTTHGGRKLKSRLGIEKKAQVRHLKKVLTNGITSDTEDDYTKSYIGYIKAKNDEYDHKVGNLKVILYNSAVYIFGKDKGSDILITAYKVGANTWRKIYGGTGKEKRSRCAAF